jgi:16S rRNA (adenine1518-N6/adenine1519-N6)-dimethyltransferase
VRAVKRSSFRRGRPRFGQHFLVNTRTVEKILDALGADEGDTVIEIGPGRGALTKPLLDRGVRVLAFEIDEDLADVLAAELSERAFFLERLDALEADFARALSDIGTQAPVPLIGNLPYESATPMLRKFVRHPELFSRIVAMVQREVAERLVAEPGSREYGFLTLDVGAHATAKKLFDVSPGDFAPHPQVVSSVVRLTPHAPHADTAPALQIASAGFNVRRKTLLNALTPLWGRDRARDGIEAAGLPATVRAETLGLREFEALVNFLGPPGRT